MFASNEVLSTCPNRVCWRREVDGTSTCIVRLPGLQPICSQLDGHPWTLWIASHNTMVFHQQGGTPAYAMDYHSPDSGSARLGSNPCTPAIHYSALQSHKVKTACHATSGLLMSVQPNCYHAPLVLSFSHHITMFGFLMPHLGTRMW